MGKLLEIRHKSAPPADDESVRERALDPRLSFIVEAPAGSGKTGLLVQRFLKLLVDSELQGPEEVLAITFTNKATAELRERVLGELQKATEALPDKAEPFEQQTHALAAAVLAQDGLRGWNLLANPGRLNIRSIDSVCAAIANSVPVLSGAGGDRAILQDARSLYHAAAHRTLLQLGGQDPELHAALRSILLHRDGRLADVEKLIAAMLADREQWGELVPLNPAELTDEHLEAVVRPGLEATLEAIVCAGLSRAARLLPAGVLADLSALAHRYSHEPGYKDDQNPLALCRTLPKEPGERAEALEHWRALISLVLTKDDKPRAGFAVNHLGFRLPKEEHPRLKELVAEFERDHIREAVVAVRNLPPARYPDEQWAVTKSLFRVLRQALGELKLLFAERSECDFAELSLAARAALEAEPTSADLALAAGGRLRHLLVDEMQDTSAAQYELLEQLTRSWDGHTQTLFLVGDPKQSIYLFRQARVERFLRVVKHGMLGELPLVALQLSANFRSEDVLVQRFNAAFKQIFPAPDGEILQQANSPDVPFMAAVPKRKSSGGQAFHWHVRVLESDPLTGKVDTAAHRLLEAQQLCGIVADWREKALPEGRRKPWRIAVLARTRGHLTDIATELREMRVPYRAVDVDPLAERQEVLDLLALTRALLNPADRIAWLAVLHAPWCGLGLADLLAITGEGPTADLQATVTELVALRRDNLTATGRQLLARAWPVLETAQETLGRTPLSTHIQRTWLSLGGDVALSLEARTNADRFFGLLRELEALDDGRVDLPTLTARLGSLYAEPQTLDPAEASVELMTIHKAKGLEWDVVLVPGLDRRSQSDRAELLNWLELDGDSAETSHILLAPIYGAGESADELNRWLRSVRASRDFAERKRVFYVACTRAREELHLFAALPRKTGGEVANPASGSLLEAAWPAAQAEFAAAAAPMVQPPSALTESGPMSIALAAEGEAEADEEEPRAPEDGVLLGLATELTAEPPHLHRLPLDFDPRARFGITPGPSVPPAAGVARPEGSFAARAFGNVVHRYLELLAVRFASGSSPDAVAADLPQWLPRIIASLRSEGIPPALAEREGERLLRALANTLADPVGRWILAGHPEAASESAYTTPQGTLRADRTFLAGPDTLSTGDTTLWIVDFKTTEKGARSPELFRAQELEKYQPQLNAYASLRAVSMAEQRPIRLALYYPLQPLLLDWTATPN